MIRKRASNVCGQKRGRGPNFVLDGAGGDLGAFRCLGSCKRLGADIEKTVVFAGNLRLEMRIRSQ
jgi:hypothetical protein